MTVLNASTLNLDQVYHYLRFHPLPYDSLNALLALEPLSEFESFDLTQIRNDFRQYLNDFRQYLIEGKVLEGMVMALTIFPLLRLAGFYHSPIKMRVDQEIARINVEDEEIS